MTQWPALCNIHCSSITVNTSGFCIDTHFTELAITVCRLGCVPIHLRAATLTCDLKRTRNPAHNSLKADVGRLQGVRPVTNPPGTVVDVAVLPIWEGDDLESAGSM